MSDLDWKTDEVRWKLFERQLYELGALVRGQVPQVSARIMDLVEQLDALRKELEAVRERQDKIADFVKAHVKEHKNGGAS